MEEGADIFLRWSFSLSYLPTKFSPSFSFSTVLFAQIIPQPTSEQFTSEDRVGQKWLAGPCILHWRSQKCFKNRVLEKKMSPQQNTNASYQWSITNTLLTVCLLTPRPTPHKFHFTRTIQVIVLARKNLNQYYISRKRMLLKLYQDTSFSFVQHSTR